MARFRSVRRERPAKKFRIPSSYVQWGALGVGVVAITFLVSRSLTRPPSETAPAPMLAAARTDLATVTRLLGDIELDSSTRRLFPPALTSRLAGADTLAEQRRWYDALEPVMRLLKDADAETRAALRGYSGLLYYRAASADQALREFRRAVAAADSSSSPLGPWLAFNAAYLFQSHGFADSCLPFYRHAESLVAGAGPGPDSAPGAVWAAWLANNMGVAYEALRDTAAAGLFRQALAIIDTLADAKSARLVRENLARVVK
jgi:tetratricopeptide (TPR) repeat protein